MRHGEEFRLLPLKKKFMQMQSHCLILGLFGPRVAGQNVLICLYMLLVFQSLPHAVAQNTNQLSALNYNFIYLGITLIFVLGCFLFFFLGVWFYSCSGTERHESIRLNSVEDGMSRRGNGGLDLNLIEVMFPTLTSSYVKGHKLGKEALECVVCLTEFEDKDLIRLLPKCGHAFHPRCIDAWLLNHTTCPVCRANLISVSCEDPATSEEQQQVALVVVPDH